jgi:hypothetical protein
MLATKGQSNDGSRVCSFVFPSNCIRESMRAAGESDLKESFRVCVVDETGPLELLLVSFDAFRV